MSLNIKNERVHQLARQAAQRSGTSQTSAIETALVRYLAELDTAARTTADSRRGRVDWILADIQGRLAWADSSTLTTDNLYDELGPAR